jgi:hypothetical protein
MATADEKRHRCIRAYSATARRLKSMAAHEGRSMLDTLDAIVSPALDEHERQYVTRLRSPDRPSRGRPGR